ncbi:MAG TPA: hypothetical protein VD913_02640, partial [bacterium]|nr:hypothetical protein [bacterium]
MLTCLLLAFVFQPNAILAGEEDIATSFEGYVILSPVPIEYASTGTPASFQAWTIKVYDEKRVRLRRNRENEQESPQQITELYQRLHRSAG